MRFVFAIVSFVLAAAMIVFGIAQRTFLAEPAEAVLSTTTTTGTAVTVIDGAALNAFGGSQTVTVSGADQIFAAYGRTSDVIGWIGDTQYTEIGLDGATGELSSTLVPGTEKSVPDPNGSDLWLDDYVKDDRLSATVKVPDTISFIVVSDGTKPAPDRIALSWPLDNSTPWSGPLIVGGAAVLLLGLVFLLWAIAHMRRSRGPRRKPQRMPKVPRRPRYKPSRKALERPVAGRRSIGRGMVAAPLVLVGILAVSGCTTSGQNGVPPGARVPTSTASAASDVAKVDSPALTERQVDRIVADISAVATEADGKRDSALLATRFQGAAFEVRKAGYAIVAADPTIPGLAPIPTGTVELALPQQTDRWPRTVLAVIKDAKDAAAAEVALVITQNDPRAKYQVSYAVTLSQGIPTVAAAAAGAPPVAPDSPLVRRAPGEVAPAYADTLDKGVDSAAYLDFEIEEDGLRAGVAAYRASIKSTLPATASATFAISPGAGGVVALATIDSGALVAANLNEVTTVAPVEAGAAVNPTGAVKALSGLAITTKGVVATYSDQLLFYVPPAGADGKIVLLGYTAGLIKAGEIG